MGKVPGFGVPGVGELSMKSTGRSEKAAPT